MLSDRIIHLLDALSSENPPFPPTELYCEGWLLRLILDWFANYPAIEHPLAFMPDARWFSEALLPSAFAPRFRADPLSESRTNADGVIGHFDIGAKGKADFSLRLEAKQFLVLEAKINSKLSARTTRADYFDQAARNVACMAEILKRSALHAEHFEKLGFYVLAPESRINRGIFAEQITRESIQLKVKRRVEAYENEEKNFWFEHWFVPMLARVDIQVMSWESLVVFITNHDSESGKDIAAFYASCLKFN